MIPQRHPPQKKLQGGTVPPSSEKSPLKNCPGGGGGQSPQNRSLNLCPDMRVLLYLTECLFSIYLRIGAYFSNKKKTKFEPGLIFNTNLRVLSVKTSWSMVSNAADKSSRVRAGTSPLSNTMKGVIRLCSVI